MNNISILLGAGFSTLDDYPMAPQMNKRLSKIGHDEIMVHTSNKSMFLNGQNDPNSHWMGMTERHFVEDFLKFYNDKVAKNGFDYETFYDYYKKQYRLKDYDQQFLDFCNQFREKYRLEYDENNLLHRFDIVYNQLVAQMVTKFYDPVHLGKPYNPKYRPFFELIELVRENATIHFHSLNHDLFLEHLAVSDTIHANLSDGFQEMDSKYFGNYQSRFKVRLPFFTDKYDTKYRLYKLHGSIDNYSYNFEGDWVYLKSKYGIDTSRVFKEVSKMVNHSILELSIITIQNFYRVKVTKFYNILQMNTINVCFLTLKKTYRTQTSLL